MASSKAKKPPAVHQRSVTLPPDCGPIDQSLFTAFKKLRMDAQGGCVKKTEDHGREALRHKAEGGGLASPSPIQENSKDDWSRSLQNFCFCDVDALNKRGTVRWRSMCRYHRLRTKKDAATAAGKTGGSSGNLAQAWRAHKPLLQEGKLRVAASSSSAGGPTSSQVLRPARLSFKPSRHSAIDFNFVKPSEVSFTAVPQSQKGAPEGTRGPPDGAEDSTTTTTTTATAQTNPVPARHPAARPSSQASLTPGHVQTCLETSASNGPVFAAAASQRLFTFSSVLPDPRGARSPSPGQEDATPTTVVRFEGHRHAPDHRRRSFPVSSHSQRGVGQPVGSLRGVSQPVGAERGVIQPVGAERAVGQSAMLPPQSGTVRATSVPVRVELAVERSCSQEARLDESEFNVNELAAYFDNFLYMPKDMSSMAQMMYT